MRLVVVNGTGLQEPQERHKRSCSPHVRVEFLGFVDERGETRKNIQYFGGIG